MSSNRIPFKSWPSLNLTKHSRYRGQPLTELGRMWLDLETRKTFNKITFWLVRNHSLKQSNYFQDMSLFIVNASCWLEWIMGHISQGWDGYNSGVNDVQNLEQMRSNCNLPSLPGQFFLKVSNSCISEGSGLIKNSVLWKIRWRKHYSAIRDHVFIVLQAHARKQTLF